jgi:hypothetical protein
VNPTQSGKTARTRGGHCIHSERRAEQRKLRFRAGRNYHQHYTE